MSLSVKLINSACFTEVLVFLGLNKFSLHFQALPLPALLRLSLLSAALQHFLYDLSGISLALKKLCE